MVTTTLHSTAHLCPIDDQLLDWQDIKNDFAQGGILIGNGFSQAVWQKFGYSSIYDAACSTNYVSNPLSAEEQRLFDSMNTRNFEMVLSRLSEASEVEQIAGKEHAHLDEWYERTKTALGEAVRAVHVPWNKVTTEILSRIRNELENYRYIYSTNYDVLPYWAIMSEKDGKGFKDYFWRERGDYPGEDPYFNVANSSIRGNSTRILYLHGALHLYRDPDTGRTCKFTNKAKSNLLSLTEVPLFITEGSSADKLKAIRNSDYLTFAYEQFSNHSAPLVLFGHSLSGSDHHLIRAIKESARKGTDRIAISIRATNSSDDIMKRKSDLRHALYKDVESVDRPKLMFFKAHTHPLGSDDVRVEE